MAVETVWLILVFIGGMTVGVSIGMRVGFREGYKLGNIDGKAYKTPLKPLVGTTRLCDKKV